MTYVPTTAQVRNNFALGAALAVISEDDRELMEGVKDVTLLITITRAQFDAWLAQVKQIAYDKGWADASEAYDDPWPNDMGEY